jgi:hypothetical protein
MVIPITISHPEFLFMKGDGKAGTQLQIAAKTGRQVAGENFRCPSGKVASSPAQHFADRPARLAGVAGTTRADAE